MFRAMPSPNGTNHEKLFVRDRSRAAYDAAGAVKNADADAVESILKWLATKLNPSDLEKVSNIIMSAAGGAEDDFELQQLADVDADMGALLGLEQAADRARRMRRVAQDAANRKGFHSRYPMAASMKRG